MTTAPGAVVRVRHGRVTRFAAVCAVHGRLVLVDDEGVVQTAEFRSKSAANQLLDRHFQEMPHL